MALPVARCQSSTGAAAAAGRQRVHGQLDRPTHAPVAAGHRPEPWLCQEPRSRQPRALRPVVAAGARPHDLRAQRLLRRGVPLPGRAVAAHERLGRSPGLVRECHALRPVLRPRAPDAALSLAGGARHGVARATLPLQLAGRGRARRRGRRPRSSRSRGHPHTALPAPGHAARASAHRTTPARGGLERLPQSQQGVTAQLRSGGRIRRRRALVRPLGPRPALRGPRGDLPFVDDRSRWPPADRLPTGFKPQAILETNANPGLASASCTRRASRGAASASPSSTCSSSCARQPFAAKYSLAASVSFGSDLEDVAHDPVVRDLEDRGVGVLVDRDDAPSRTTSRPGAGWRR